MLNTKQNLMNRKITEALKEIITGTDPMLFLEVYQILEIHLAI